MSFDTTELLGLPCIMPAQAQKHVTHNEALRRLDALVQLAVRSRSLTAPPPAPAPGERHIVAAGAGGAWAGHDGEIAAWLDGAWTFFAANAGWRAWLEDEQKLLVHGAGGWSDIAPAPEQAPKFGINTAADTANRLAVKSDAALFAHDDQTPGSGDMRLTIDKAAAANTGTLIFQTAAAGRAELGLAGNDDFTLKVSADGETWKEAIKLAGDGQISLGDPVNFANIVPPLSTLPAVSIGNNDTARPTLGLQAAMDGTAAGTRFDFFRARGTISSPSMVVEDDTIAAFNSFGFDGVSYRQTGAIRFVADATPTTGATCPTRISFMAGTTGATERLRISSAGVVQPGTDNAQDLGSSARRWKDIYAGNGTIQTSDARAKTPLRELEPSERSVARKLSWLTGIYRWRSAIEIKGENARLHMGVTAQDILSAFEAAGLDGFRYGVVCSDTSKPYPDGEDRESPLPSQSTEERLGVRYDQLLLWIIAGFEDRLASVENAAR